MLRRLIMPTTVAVVLLASHVRASWVTLDDFSGQGPIGANKWYQTTPLPNFYMGGGRLLTSGKAMAVHTGSLPGDYNRLRFDAFSGLPGVDLDGSVQAVSALLALKNPDNYYEVRLLADNVSSTDFYRLHFYSVLGGTAIHDRAFELPGGLDAVRLDAAIHNSSVTVFLQPFDRDTGLDLGGPLSYSFGSVPMMLADDPNTSRIGLAAQGRYMEIDNFQGLVAPEPATLMAVALAALPLLKRRRGSRIRH